MERKATNHHSLAGFINLAEHLQIVYRDASTLEENESHCSLEVPCGARYIVEHY
jgi:hypothetical protein